MIGSLYSGLSGIQNHQKYLEVIGNNISNVNTVGYKAGRILFSDTVSQSIEVARLGSEGLGGRDPKQVGAGVKIKSIDNLFTQGSLRETGVSTDLALDGRGFFTLSDGKDRYFTRAGAFDIDELGLLVDSGTGMVVQGKAANNAGEIEAGTPMDDIQLNFGGKIPAKETTEIRFASNLDARGSESLIVADTAFTKTITMSDTALTTNIGASAHGSTEINDLDQVSTDLSDGDTITISGTDSDGAAVSATFTYGANNDGTTLEDLVTAIETALPNSTVEIGENGNIMLTPTDTPNPATQVPELALSLTDTDGDGSSVVFPGFNPAVVSVDEDTEINSLDQVTTNLTEGDTITISGTDSTGDPVNVTFTFGDPATDPNYDGTTLKDLLEKIDGAFVNCTPTIESNGNLALEPPNDPDEDLSFSLAFTDVDTSGSAMTLPEFDFEGYKYDTSFLVYDSEGNEHTATMVFEKLSEFRAPSYENKWSWEISIPEVSVKEGTNTGTITFNSDGSLKNFSFTNEDATSFQFNPGNGAGLVSIELDVGTEGGFGGITQFAARSNVAVRYQDGYKMGMLQDFDIDEQGFITGIFGNGVSRTLAQLSIAYFNNPSGLLKEGDSYYQASANSGQAILGEAGTSGLGYVRSRNLELSNVDLAKEFINLVIAQRGFQANSNVITTTDTIFGDIMRLKRA